MLLIRSLINLDIFDVNWDVSSKEINQVELTGSGKFGVFEGAARFFLYILKSIFYFKFNISTFKSRVLRVSGTSNQSKALSRLSSLGELIQIGNISDNRNNNSFEAVPYLISIVFFPLYLWKVISEKDKFKRKMLLCRMDRFIFSYGLFFFFHLVMNKQNTKLIIISNDHSVWQRTLILVARSKGIAVAYVQHANVSSLFPRLSVDYAFLDGQHACNAYAKEAYCKVIRVGCLRFENYKSFKTEPETTARKGILLCFNKVDSDKMIVDTLNNVNRIISSDQVIGVRFHPADNRTQLFKNEQINISFVDETQKDLDDVLSRYEYCFAGVSSIFLEASLANLYCFSVRDIFFDYFNFEVDGIVKVFPCWQSVELSSVKNTRLNATLLYNSCEDYLKNIELPSDRINCVLKGYNSAS